MRNVCALGSTPLMPHVINIILFHNSVNMDAVIKSSRRALTEAWTAITTRMENKADEWEEGERSFDQTPPFELTHTFFLQLYLNPTLTCLFKDLGSIPFILCQKYEFTGSAGSTRMNLAYEPRSAEQHKACRRCGSVASLFSLNCPLHRKRGLTQFAQFENFLLQRQRGNLQPFFSRYFF